MFEWQEKKKFAYSRVTPTQGSAKKVLSKRKENKMSAKDENIEREAGGIVFTKKRSTRELVADAYECSEKTSWNTMEERLTGKPYWTGSKNTNDIIKEESPDPTGAKWKRYCRDLFQKEEKRQDKENIVPTRPHRPIVVKKDKEQQPSQNTTEDQQKIVDEWIAKIEAQAEEEDKIRSRGG